MKHSIFYFTGTGNSLKVAQEIAEQQGDTKIMAMGTHIPFRASATYQSIGLVFPTYFFGMPMIVKQFIKNFSIEHPEKTYIYAITTYGGTAGNAMRSCRQALAEQGLSLQYGRELKAKENYILMYKMTELTPQEDQKFLGEIQAIAEDVKAQKTRKVGNEYIGLPLIHKYFERNVYTRDKHFQVSSDCNGCKLCEQLCPVGNIVMDAKKPMFQHHCENCMTCLQYCPKQAINYKQKTQKRGRYHYPTITANVLMKQKKQ